MRGPRPPVSMPMRGPRPGSLNQFASRGPPCSDQVAADRPDYCDRPSSHEINQDHKDANGVGSPQTVTEASSQTVESVESDWDDHVHQKKSVEMTPLFQAEAIENHSQDECFNDFEDEAACEEIADDLAEKDDEFADEENVACLDGPKERVERLNEPMSKLKLNTATSLASPKSPTKD